MQQEANVQSDLATLERTVEHRIHERTFRRVQNLKVELHQWPNRRPRNRKILLCQAARSGGGS